LTTLKSANAFEVVAREWLAQRAHEWATSSADTMLARLERHLLPKLGPRPVAEITAPDVLPYSAPLKTGVRWKLPGG